MVMERLLEKLKCRTIMVENGAEAMRLAMGEVKFDIILMEFKLPQINGEDVARMIRTTKNPNSSTPIVAVTGYLKDLSDPDHFDEVMEKPATQSKLTRVLEQHCYWRAPDSENGERKELLGTGKANDGHNHHNHHRGRTSPTVEQFMAARSRSQYSVDDDAVSVASSTDPFTSSSRGNHDRDWDRIPLGSTMSSEPEAYSSSPVTTNTIHQESSAATRLQFTHSLERIPSPLSTHVSIGTIEPPSASEDKINHPETALGKSPLGASPPLPIMPLHRFRTHPPATGADGAQKTKASDKGNRFSMLFSSSRDREASDQDDEDRPTIDFKNKSKRSSLEKKKEKQSKQRKDGLLGEEADADDEDSLSGGKKPSKARSIGEIIRGVNKRG